MCECLTHDVRVFDAIELRLFYAIELRVFDARWRGLMRRGRGAHRGGGAKGGEGLGVGDW